MNEFHFKFSLILIHDLKFTFKSSELSSYHGLAWAIRSLKHHVMSKGYLRGIIQFLHFL